jgi:selenocysteine lyase/cysteine desulfurase
MTANFKTPLDSEKIRESFPILKEVIYMNVGTYGIMPEPALENFLKYLKEIERSGVASKGDVYRKYEETYKHIATMISADVQEIAYNRNATDGINFVLSGIDWKEGDEVISTLEEHEAMFHPLMYLQKTKKIKPVWIEISPDPDVMLSRIQNVANKKTRLIAISYVTCESGTRLPGKEICEWASNKGILTLLDGAQATGNFPVNVRDLGCDYYASNGHKWLSGPKGTGFFYGKKDKLKELSPAHVGAGSLERVDKLTDVADPWLSARRFEFGTRCFELYAGLGCALDWFDGLGWDNVYQHIRNLSDYLKNNILERDYLKLLSPVKFEDSSGLVTFSMPGHHGGDISTYLREKSKIHTRVIPHYDAIRLSTAHFNTDGDVNVVMNTLEQLHRGG